jgi:tRNA (Thr-GGU) A37 N-methylase
MAAFDDYTLRPIGFVRSTLTDRQTAPRQGYDGAPEAWIEMTPEVLDGLLGV